MKNEKSYEILSKYRLHSIIFHRTEDDKITLERRDGNECWVNVGNAQVNDSGLWVFTIGTMEGESYMEVESKHIVNVIES